MSLSLFADLAVFVISVLVGIEVISRVPVALHTPLMSGANAIHGIVVVGAALITATATTGWAAALEFGACAFAAANAVGGYVVTDRMLEMFRPRVAPATVIVGGAGQPGAR